MRVAALAVLLALAAFALPAAHAQVTNPACAPIDIPNQPAVPDPVPPGGQAQVRVEVRNANQVAVDVTVAAEASAPGWQVAAPPPATIAGGQTGTFTFTVTATSSATTDMTLRIAATGVCQSQGLPCPGTVCNAGSANAQVLVPLEPERGFTLPGLDALNVAPEILIAGIVFIGLASA
ncbi:MAG TPA: hypothetical protein VFH78_06205, partial [Candidatus Thermoplasmatota archaeon]|nr:hypothetical protein [Candidatus Thermoplasmatota archaeon]